MAKTRGFAIFCNFLTFFLPFQFAIPHAIPKGNPNSTKRCFGHPSFCLIYIILPTNAGPVVSVVWDDRAAACPNVSEMRVAFPDVLYTEEQR